MRVIKKYRIIYNNIKEFAVPFIIAFCLFISIGWLIIKGTTPTVNRYRVVTSKTIEYSNGLFSSRTFYVIGFNDNYTKNVTFGEYSNTSIGDTVFYKSFN